MFRRMPALQFAFSAKTSGTSGFDNMLYNTPRRPNLTHVRTCRPHVRADQTFFNWQPL